MTVDSQVLSSDEKNIEAYSLFDVPAHGGRGQVVLKFTFEGRITDLRAGDSKTEIDRINYGGVTIIPQSSEWRAFFEKEVIEVARDRRMTVIVKNDADHARKLRLEVSVTPGNVSNAALVQKSANIAKANATIRRERKRPKPVLRKKTVVRGNKSNVVLPSAMDEIESLVTPGEGERATLILRGHIAALVRFFEHRVPMHPAMKQSIIGQLDRAIAYKEGPEGAISPGTNEAVAVLKASALPKMIQSIRASSFVISDAERLEVLEALHESTQRKTPLTPKQVTKASRMQLSQGAAPSSG